MPPLSEFWRQGTVNGMFNLAVRTIYHSLSSFWGNKSCSIDKTSQGMNKPTENIQPMLLIHPEPKAETHTSDSRSLLLAGRVLAMRKASCSKNMCLSHSITPQTCWSTNLTGLQWPWEAAAFPHPPSHKSDFQGEMDLICLSSRAGSGFCCILKVSDVL